MRCILIDNPIIISFESYLKHLKTFNHKINYLKLKQNTNLISYDFIQLLKEFSYIYYYYLN